MGQKLSPADQELYRRVDEVLHYIWDPIGVSRFPGARTEYRSYLPEVFKLLKGNSDAKTIASYLIKVETGHMTLVANRHKAREAANILIEWKETIEKQNS